MPPAIWLNEADVRATLDLPSLIPAMRDALIAFSTGGVKQPLRSVIEVDSAPSFLATMPAFAPSIQAFGAKLVTVFGANPARGLHSHLATILLLDAVTGALLAVMDGRYITEARTAAVSAVALDLLAPLETPVLAIFGSGVQARSHLEALALVRRFREIRCWSPNPQNRERFAAESAGYPVTAAASAEEAVRGADAVVLVTSSAEPVVKSGWVGDGACVISVGACRPNQREMDPDLVVRARLIVDSRVSALAESGDIVQGIAEGRFSASHVAAELGEVADGRASGEAKPIVFKSLGLAVEDVAAAKLAYQSALRLGKGVPLA
jgi:ornithine cyclodeaminase/alanine dehydrogenase-like protein (mu-crystallin family)